MDAVIFLNTQAYVEEKKLDYEFKLVLWKPSENAWKDLCIAESSSPCNLARNFAVAIKKVFRYEYE